jgi:hypothetical protein
LQKNEIFLTPRIAESCLTLLIGLDINFPITLRFRHSGKPSLGQTITRANLLEFNALILLIFFSLCGTNPFGKGKLCKLRLVKEKIS